MTKRLKSKYSVCKKIKNTYKNLWGSKSKECFRSLVSKKKHKLSYFSKLLNIKQTLKFFYSNIKELTFKKYIFYSVSSQSKTVDKLVSILESRVDTLLFRSCLVGSFHEARQFINHKFVLVNNMYVVSPNLILKKGDFIQLKFCKRKLLSLNVKNFQEKLYARSFPSYIEINLNFLFIVFLWDVNLKTVYYPIDLFYQNIGRYYK